MEGRSQSRSMTQSSLFCRAPALGQSLIQRWPGARPSADLQELVATVVGWSAGDNGLLHARGVDDGFLFVADGIPLSDRIDSLFAGSIDTDMIQSMKVINGHIPVEYGYASGGVISILRKSGRSGGRGTMERKRTLSRDRAQFPGGFSRSSSRRVVAYGTSVSRAMARIDMSGFCARSSRTCRRVLSSKRGRPTCFPSIRALAIPAFTRSDSRIPSWFASAASSPISASLKIPVESR